MQFISIYFYTYLHYNVTFFQAKWASVTRKSGKRSAPKESQSSSKTSLRKGVIRNPCTRVQSSCERRNLPCCLPRLTTAQGKMRHTAHPHPSLLPAHHLDPKPPRLTENHLHTYPPKINQTSLEGSADEWFGLMDLILRSVGIFINCDASIFADQLA